MKNYLLAGVLLMVAPAFGQSMSDRQKGEILGAVGFSALTLDAFFEVCQSRGVRTDNNLRGIDKLAKQKWGVTFSEVSRGRERATGRDFRGEAHILVNSIVSKFGSCDAQATRNWIQSVNSVHTANLRRFQNAP